MAGMTAMTIAIPTGFVVARDSLEAIYAAEYPGLRRARFRDGWLIILWQNVSPIWLVLVCCGVRL